MPGSRWTPDVKAAVGIGFRAGVNAILWNDIDHHWNVRYDLYVLPHDHGSTSKIILSS
jgi:hypothetical protein